MADNGAFSIVHHGILEDERFATIIPDPVALSTWLLMLMAADKAYPSAAAIPFGTKAAGLKKLSDAGIIELKPNHQFIVHGMAAERSARAERWKKAARARWDKERRTGDADAS